MDNIINDYYGFIRAFGSFLKERAAWLKLVFQNIAK